MIGQVYRGGGKAFPVTAADAVVVEGRVIGHSHSRAWRCAMEAA